MNDSHTLAHPNVDDFLRSPIAILLHSKARPLFDQEFISRAIIECSPYEYPEGTLEFLTPSEAAFKRLYETRFHYSSEFPDWPLTDGFWLRNLVSFPLRQYWLVVRRDYIDPMRDGRVGIGIAGGHLEWFPGEKQLDDLPFTVWFHRVPSKRTKAELARRLSAWFCLVGQQGIDGEGPIRPAVPQMIFRGRRADVRLDAVRTGPRTMMWLTLEALRFGHEVSPLEIIGFNSDDETDLKKELAGIKNAFEIMGRSWTEEDEQKHLLKRLGGGAEPQILPLDIGRERRGFT
jgi:hypothetical protein